MKKIQLTEKVYIFDLDGTLIDSMPPAVKIVLDFLDEQGISYPPDIVTILTPLGFKGVAKYYAEVMGVNMPAEEIIDYFSKRLNEEYFYRIPAKENAEQALQYLREQGCRLSVLTASPHLLTDAVLKRLGLWEYFENVWTLEDLGGSKGELSIYDKVADMLAVDKSECVMVDDNLTVLKTAKAAGMKIIGVFEKSTEKECIEAEQISDGFVYNFDQFLP